MIRLLLFCLIITITACQSNNEKTEKTTPVPPSSLPALSMEKAKYIWDNCDYIDYVFYELPFSMSLDKKIDIQGTVRHISASPVPVLKPECKSIGRIFFQEKGENILSAEFYFAIKEGCFYYVFMEDEKPVYANLLTQEAVAYYNKTFSMVKSQGVGQ